MIISKKGIYITKQTYKGGESETSWIILKGTTFSVLHIDPQYQTFYSPVFKNWVHWDIDAERVGDFSADDIKTERLTVWKNDFAMIKNGNTDIGKVTTRLAQYEDILEKYNLLNSGDLSDAFNKYIFARNKFEESKRQIPNWEDLPNDTDEHYLVLKNKSVIGCTGNRSTKEDVLKLHPTATFKKVEGVCSVCKKTVYMDNNEKIFALDSKTKCEIANNSFHHNIPVDLYEKRDKFCPTTGSITCDRQCPIYSKYYPLGLSCNGALDKYPDDCISLMYGVTLENETDESAGIPHIFSVIESALALAGYKIMDGSREETLIVRHSAIDSDFEIKITELA